MTKARSVFGGDGALRSNHLMIGGREKSFFPCQMDLGVGFLATNLFFVFDGGCHFFALRFPVL